MKRSLSTLVVLAALSGLAYAEGAVEQAPGHLIAMADITERAYTTPAKTPADFTSQARGELQQVANDLSKKLEERMEHDLQLAMQ